LTYPDTTPGFKGTIETGREAAYGFARKLGARQAEVMADLLANGPSTAEQIAERTGRHWYVVRPRISELRNLGLVIDTGGRVETGMGGKTHQVRLTTAKEREDWLNSADAADAAEAEQ
jgi:predicted transcriptional regulator